jgi:hypothetical protein
VSDFVLDVPKNLHGSRLHKAEVWKHSARVMHDLLCDVAGAGDLGEKAILHYGCGAKMSKFFLESDVAVKRYVGIDSSSELVAFLQSTVVDERFEYHHVNIYNEMYNREGSRLADVGNLPVRDQLFDVICLFSVFTHLAPHDYKPLLRLLRPHASENTRLVYTLFLNERTTGGHAMMDKWGPVIEEYGDIPADTLVPDFVDFFPDKPLRAAVYSRSYAMELVKDTGWHVEEVRDPTLYIQHAFICSPG